MTQETAAPAEEQAPVVSISGAVAVFSPIEAVLSEARTKYENVVYDLTTTKGDKEARAARAELVRIRTSADKAYKEWNQPVLEQQRIAREKVAHIKGEVEKLEGPIDEQIRADEERREAERKAKAEAEAARIKVIRDRINVIANLPLSVLSMNSEQIAAVIGDLDAMPVNQECFGEFVDEAVALVADMKAKLADARDAAAAREAEAARIEEARAALERQRQQQEAEAAAERERLAKEAAAMEEARKAQEAEIERQRILAEEAQRQAALKATKDAQDAAAAIKAQQDAFAAEREAAEKVLRDEEDRVRAERAALAKERADQAAEAQGATATAVAAAQESVAKQVVEQLESAAVRPLLEAVDAVVEERAEQAVDAKKIADRIAGAYEATNNAAPVNSASAVVAAQEQAAEQIVEQLETATMKPLLEAADELVKERAEEPTGKVDQAIERPSDLAILMAVASAFRVEQETAYNWLATIDMTKLSESIEYTTIPF